MIEPSNVQDSANPAEPGMPVPEVSAATAPAAPASTDLAPPFTQPQDQPQQPLGLVGPSAPAVQERMTEEHPELRRIREEIELQALEREMEYERRRGRREHARAHHGRTLAANKYAEMVASATAGSYFRDTDVDYAEDLLERLAPQDPIQELLGEQLLLQRARSFNLSSKAASETDTLRLNVLNNALNGNMKLMTKLGTELSQLRKQSMRRRGAVTIGQANVAGQQIVVNDHRASSLSAKELIREIERLRTTIPNHHRGACVPSGGGRQEPAMDKKHGPQNSGG